jgi:hypothetical protein
MAAAIVAASVVPSAGGAAPVGSSLGASAARPAGAAVLAHGSNSYRGYRRDCRPYNGPYGYYGNPWCDGGFKRPEDQMGRGFAWYWDGYAPRRYWKRRW